MFSLTALEQFGNFGTILTSEQSLIALAVAFQAI
jgi:hypothetical protein